MPTKYYLQNNECIELIFKPFIGNILLFTKNRFYAMYALALALENRKTEFGRVVRTTTIGNTSRLDCLYTLFVHMGLSKLPKKSENMEECT